MIRHPLTHHRPSASSHGKKKYRIALFTRTAKKVTERFSIALCKQLKEMYHLSFDLEIISCTDYVRLEQGIKSKQIHAVVTLEHKCTLHARSTIKSLNSTIPVIFSCVDGTSSLTRTNTMTGTITPFDEYVPQFLQVLSYTPQVKDILVLHDTNSSYIADIQSPLIARLKQTGYQVTALPFAGKLSRKEMFNLGQHNMVMLLHAHPSESDIKRLAHLCVEHKSILYVSDTTAIQHGAAFGFGTHYSRQAQHIAQMLYDTLTHHTLPDLTVVPLHLSINIHALHEQGHDLSQAMPLISMINNTHPVRPSTQDRVNAYLRLEQIPLE